MVPMNRSALLIISIALDFFCAVAQTYRRRIITVLNVVLTITLSEDTVGMTDDLYKKAKRACFPNARANHERRAGGTHAAQTLETPFVLLDHESRFGHRHVIHHGGGHQRARTTSAVCASHPPLLS